MPAIETPFTVWDFVSASAATIRTFVVPEPNIASTASESAPARSAVTTAGRTVSALSHRTEERLGMRAFRMRVVPIDIDL
ncbi:hypothetical protein KIF24_31100 [Micromonospora sp. Llam7]|uniref:hypothetical protein n=1 Tax=Micromonospora tarapacensis TaxID=2835305 RepID=UPI001C83B853|nr:hypothetical protein [Micromonospora tarapacensis]MBX7270031.1 hypothetical protein [Micromonospora tarapacensis]